MSYSSFEDSSFSTQVRTASIGITRFCLQHSTVYLFLLLLCSSSVSLAQASSPDQHALVAMRLIGHEILLHAGDSSSLVLPITQEEQRYKIQFEKEFSFKPDELEQIVDSVLISTKTAKSYIVEVERCETKELVYSFEVLSAPDSSMIPCRGRDQEIACLVIYITILEDFAVAFSSSSSETNNSYFIIALLLIAISSIILLVRNLKKKTTAAEINDDIIELGEYKFDKKNMVLHFNGELTELSSKESDLLELLYSSENETLERQEILRVVWGDDGDYVGRTLDVFVSKLRKKLEADSNIKIVNVRGVGYKLILNSI